MVGGDAGSGCPLSLFATMDGGDAGSGCPLSLFATLRVGDAYSGFSLLLFATMDGGDAGFGCPLSLCATRKLEKKPRDFVIPRARDLTLLHHGLDLAAQCLDIEFGLLEGSFLKDFSS